MKKFMYFMLCMVCVCAVSCKKEAQPEKSSLGQYELVKLADKFGLNLNGSEVLPVDYDVISLAADDVDLVIAQKGEQTTVLTAGNKMVTDKIKSVDIAEGGFAYVSTEDSAKYVIRIGTDECYGPSADVKVIDKYVFALGQEGWGVDTIGADTETRHLAPQKYAKIYVLQGEKSKKTAIAVQGNNGWLMYSADGVEGTKYRYSNKQIKKLLRPYSTQESVGVIKVKFL